MMFPELVKDKENLDSTPKKQPLEPAHVRDLMPRTPLQDVNHFSSTNKLTKKMMYSQVTPSTTPISRTPIRKKIRATRLSVLGLLEPHEQEPQVALNALIYKRVMQIVESERKNYEKLLEEKDEKISCLLQEMRQQSSQEAQEKDGIAYVSEEENLDIFADHIVITAISNAVNQLKMTSPENVMEKKNSSCQSGNTERMSPLGIVLTQNSGQKACSHDSDGDMPPFPTPISDYRLKTEEFTATGSPPSVVVTHHTKQVGRSVGHLDGDRQCAHQEPNQSVETMVREIRWVDSANSPINMIKRTSLMGVDSREFHDKMVQATSPSLTHKRQVTQDSSQMTTPVRTCDASQVTTPPVSKLLVDAAQMTTPKGVVESWQTTTPMKMTDTGVGTSPFCHGLPRPSDVFSRELNVVELSGQLETAAVSNQLLREELVTLQKSKQELEAKLEKICHQLTSKDVQLDTLNEKIRKVEHESEIYWQEQMSSCKLQLEQERHHTCELQQLVDQNAETMRQTIEKHDAEVQTLKNQQHNLQEDLVRAYKLRKKEIEELHQQYKEKDYRPHYERAQQLITELQEELKIHVNLFHQVEETAQLQEKVHDKITEGHRKLAVLAKNLDMEKASHKLMENRVLECETTRAEAEQKCEEMQRQYEQIQTGLLSALKELSQSEVVQNENSISFKNQFSGLYELQSGIKKLKEEKQENETVALKLKADLESSCSQEQKLFLENANTCAVLKVTENELEKEKIILQTTRTKMQVTVDRLEQECKTLTEEGAQLTEKLSASENSLAASAKENRHIQTLNKDLEQDIRCYREQISALQKNEEIVRNLHENLKTLQSQAVENQEFLEHERAMLEDALKETEENLATTQMEMARYKVAFLGQTKQNKELQETVNELRENLSETQAELDATKAHSQYLLMNQNEEIKAADAVARRLQERMGGLLDELSNRVSNVTTNKQDNTSHKENLTESKAGQTLQSSSEQIKSKASSLVSSIMQAVNAKMQDSQTVTNADRRESVIDRRESVIDRRESVIDRRGSVIDRRESVIGSEGSAFVRVQNTGKSSDLEENQDTANQNTVEMCDTSAEEELIPLADQLTHLGMLLSQIVSLIGRLETQVNTNFSEIQQKHEAVQRELSRTEKQHKTQLSCLQEEMKTSRFTHTALQEQLQEKTTHLASTETSLKHAKNKLAELAETLADFSDQSCTVQNLEKEICQLRKDLKEKSYECSLLEEELNKAAVQMDENKSGTNNNTESGAVMLEVHNLKRENYRLKEQILEKKEQMAKIKEKASRRMTVYEGNWQKAEAELIRLDNFLETIRTDLEASYDKLKNFEVIRKILVELKGDQTINSPKRVWNKTLSRVKALE